MSKALPYKPFNWKSSDNIVEKQTKTVKSQATS